MLGTSIPLVMEFAKSHDMHPLLRGMIWTFSAGGKLFAYQSGVLIVGYHTDISRRAIWCVWAHASPSWSSSFCLLVPFYWPLIGLK